VPLHAQGLPNHLREALVHTDVDKIWNAHPALQRKLTYTLLDLKDFSDIDNLINARVLKFGSDAEHNSYVFADDELLTYPITIEKGNCRQEEPSVLKDLVERFGGHTENTAGSGMNTFKGLSIMLTYLGAAANLTIDDIEESAIAEADHLHCEGYGIYKPTLARSLDPDQLEQDLAKLRKQYS